MKIHYEKNKLRLLLWAILLVPAVLLFLETWFAFWVLPLYAAALFAVMCLDFELSEKVPWVWTAVLYTVSAAFTGLCVQITILDPEAFHKLDRREQILNICLILAVYFLLHMIIARPRAAAPIAHCLLVLGALADYFVYVFRQNEITFADATSLGTGVSVLKSYHMLIHDRGAYVILMSILFVVFTVKLKIDFKNKWLTRLLALVICVALNAHVYTKTVLYETQTWQMKGSTQNGFILNFMLSVRDNFIAAPDGYSAEEIAKLEEEYAAKETASRYAPSADVKDPTIIVIMNESFSDLSVLGDLATNKEVMPFTNSLYEDTLNGYALSSVFGAKTPNSEWEFMTGHSMAFLPPGSVVYQQFLQKQPYSIVHVLNDLDYTTIAMHPYLSTGWRRNTVYPRLGFDETHFMDDGYFDEAQTIRKYISDKEMYRKIIDRYEEKKAGEKLFFMGITMQNHGGYKDEYPDFPAEVTAGTGEYFDVNQFLTLDRESDDAVEELVSYFSNVDEPVEIVFFGDHQPSLSEEFYRSLNGKGMSGLTMDELEDFFKVPFFIWTNYEAVSVTMDCASLNYLSLLTLERAGIDLPPYYRFLADMLDAVPAINSRGYFSKTTGRFQHLEEAQGEEAEWIWKYEALQYNSMFDKRHRSAVFFP